MPSIFISYRRSDSGGHAGRLYDRLTYWYEKDELFFDVDSIDCGENFPDEINSAITSAKAVIVVIGPDWVETINSRVDHQKIDFVRQEISITLKRKTKDSVEIFPVLVGNTAMPQRSDLHVALQKEIGKLFDYQMIDFLADNSVWNSQFDRLRELLSSVIGIPQPSAQISHGDGYLTFQSRDKEPLKKPIQLNVDAVQKEFKTVSSALLNWPQEIEGHWIERPELDQLYKLTTQNKVSVTVLLGRPGIGKTAILSRLGSILIGEGVLVLAIKADEIPRNLSTMSDFDNWVGCGLPVKEVLSALALERRVVVLVDQLDALSELMDQHSDRLGLIIRFVNSVHEVPNVHLLVSCREFEFRHDVRFNSLNAEEKFLDYPSWDTVESLLEDHGFNTSGWSEEVCSVLSRPQHLAMFLHYLSNERDEPLFSSYQSLLAQIIEKRLRKECGDRTVEVAENIAVTMASEEELWVSRSKFEPKFNNELQHLEKLGFLIRSKNQLSIAFRHQTVFDFLRARAFTREGQSLVKYIVEEKKQSLFVRPILWSTLNYLRASDAAIYRREFNELWNRPDVRPHIQSLLVKFLGQLKNPDNQEACWLNPRFESQQFRVEAFRAIAGSRGWFDLIRNKLPTYMRASLELSSQIVVVLAKAVSFESDTVLELVEKYWVQDTKYINYGLIVMREFKSWDERSVEVVCELAGHGLQENFFIQTIAKKISEARPDLAPKVIFRDLQARKEKIDRTSQNHRAQLGTDHSEGETLGREYLVQYESLIDKNPTWSDEIENIARRHPRAFVEEMWPWLEALLHRLEKNADPYKNTYNSHSGSFFKDETKEHEHLQKSMEIAIRSFAETEVEDFLIFFKKHKCSDHIVVHRLLLLGLERIASQQPSAVLQYLLEDTRRFTIGDTFNEHCYSQTLISATAPNLNDEEILLLEKAIKAWNLFTPTSKDIDPATKLGLKKHNRIHRLKLLRVIPIDRLSSASQTLITQEERTFMDATHNSGLIGGGFIGSPMSSEQMERATNEEILGLFEILSDDTDWEHPTRPWSDMVGGSIQASREFGKFASKSPERALQLIPYFQSRKTERPAGEALLALSESYTQPEELISCIHNLEKRGFESDHFRFNAARCLEKIASCHEGLNDDTCILLENWIKDWESDDNPTDTLGQHQRRNRRSLLWGMRGHLIVPEGNFHYLDAIHHGYLARSPSDINQWLGVLERHLERKENPVVWQLLAENFWQLVDADRVRAIKFICSFFSRYPRIFSTDTGVILVAHTIMWLPSQLIEGILETWKSVHWQYGPQSAGEILALKFCRNPDDTATQNEIEKLLYTEEYEVSAVDEMRGGVANTLVIAWSEPALRSLTTKYLVQLLSLKNNIVDDALGKSLENLLGDEGNFLADEYTREILEMLLRRPKILKNLTYVLIRSLKELLRAGWKPELIYRVTKVLMSQYSNEFGDISSSISAYSGDIADLALTLHRISETKDLGLELFENLIEAQSYGIEERISVLDREAFK